MAYRISWLHYFYCKCMSNNFTPPLKFIAYSSRCIFRNLNICGATKGIDDKILIQKRISQA